MDTTMSTTTTTCFQEAWNKIGAVDDNDDEATTTAVEEVFFELANTQEVTYRLDRFQLDSKQKNHQQQPQERGENIIKIRQDVDGAANKHTGGIVWETAYLLLNYLLMIDNCGRQEQQQQEDLGLPRTNATHQQKEKTNNRTMTLLEVGAGCGMVGLVLKMATEMGLPLRLFNDDDINNDNHSDTSTMSSGRLGKIIVTETADVLPNLQKNIESNTTEDNDHHEDDDNGSISCDLQVHPLDWTSYQKDCLDAGIEPHSVDWIVGTDVVFSPRFVDPLLQTLAYLSHSKTVIYLCLQERCAKSYKLLLEKARDGVYYTVSSTTNDEKIGKDDSECTSFEVNDISQEVYTRYSQSCGWGARMECKLLKFTVKKQKNMKAARKKQEEKKKKKKRRRSDESSKLEND